MGFAGRYQVAITVGHRIQVSSFSGSSYSSAGFSPMVTGFVLRGFDKETNQWKTILNYADNRVSYNICDDDGNITGSASCYIAPTVYRNCFAEGASYNGWISDYNHTVPSSSSYVDSINTRNQSCPPVQFFNKDPAQGTMNPTSEQAPYNPYFDLTGWFGYDNLTAPDVTGGCKYYKEKTNSVSVDGPVGIMVAYKRGTTSNIHGYFYFATLGCIKFTGFEDNVAKNLILGITVYDNPAGTPVGSTKCLNSTFYPLASLPVADSSDPLYSIAVSDKVPMREVYRNGTTEELENIWYGTLSAECGIVVWPDVPQLSDKTYDGQPFDPTVDFPQTVSCYVKDYICGGDPVYYGEASVSYVPKTEVSKDVGTYEFEAHISFSDPDEPALLHTPGKQNYQDIYREVVVDVSAHITQRQISFALVSDPPLIEDKVYDKQPMSYNMEYYLDKRAVIVGGDGFAPGDEDLVRYVFTKNEYPTFADNVNVGDYRVTLNLEVKCDSDSAFRNNYRVSWD